ncbi:CaiB/BaiF CoA transferase family protein [Aestuariibius insulae]|uniref:CaiB/BaiF CoA transferase family protein n=1 Tax=Aestuariibius insulae TaxID=2058287 RepID=UPI00345E62E8
MSAPLSGIRVIDWTHVLAGPACAYYLGMLGADVIKVERPVTGDAIRHRGGTDKARAAKGMSTAYMTQGGGKRSIAIDLEAETGRDVFRRLLKSADVLVENHRPSTLERLGLTEEETRAINSRLIHCAMTGYGRGGEMADTPAYDVNIQAVSGLMSMTGTAESGPIRTGAPIIDYATGLSAAFAVTSALFARTQTNTGSFVDVSMLETAFSLMSSTITDYQLTGSVPQRRGNAANSRSVTSGTFPCRNGHISLGVNEDGQFRRLAKALGQIEWLEDDRLSTRRGRDAHADLIAGPLGTILAERDADEWEQILWREGVPAAKLRDLPDAIALPTGQSEDRTEGQIGAQLPFRFMNVEPKHRSDPPALGQDTIEILEELGYASQAIATLLQAGVVQGDAA